MDLRAEVEDDGWVKKVCDDYTTADLTDIDRALCDHAVKLTVEPASMTAADLGSLRDLGLTDRQITDATQVISYFNYINRIADGLGIDLEDGMERG